MDPEKICELIEDYADEFSHGSLPRPQSFSARGLMQHQQLEHLAYMAEEIRRRVDSKSTTSGQPDRWLGFVQGVLWSLGLVDIDSLKQDVKTKL